MPPFRPARSALRIVVSIAVASACASLSAPSRAADTAPPNHEIKDPQYGDALYQFFQDRYFTSITTLMASQKFERVEHHSDEAEILRGGMLDSYGLTKEAGEIFSHLIERGATPAVRDRAWFYLAKIRYQRGYMVEAEEAIAHVENHLPPELEEERALLLANLLMVRQDFAGAASALNPLVTKTFLLRKTVGSYYARYNLGIALLRSGEPKRGTELLDQIGKESAQGEEARSLRDRANVALGFSSLADNRPKDARVYLERVRLQSLQSNKALLGFGWAADALKDPKLALVPWTELAQRGDGDNAVLEAQIAVPYAYAELGAYGQALQGYEGAITAFERENADLTESIKAIRNGTLIDSLVEQNPGDEMGWFWRIRDLPTMPHARHLAQVLAQHEFQESLKNYRDLRYLSRNLDEWRDKLVVFDDMLATRRKAFADRLPQTLERRQQLTVDALTKRRDAIAAQIAQGETDADGLIFADDKELALLDRLAEVKKAVDDPVASADVSALRDRVRLVSGVLNWQLSQAFSSRLWTEQQELKTIDAGLAEADARAKKLDIAQHDEPIRFERFGQRIAAIRPLLQVMIPRVAGLSREQRTEAQDVAIAELTNQQQRIASYTTQARFALAQLYDRANGKADDKTDGKSDNKPDPEHAASAKP
jgi:hypothetical protein